MFLCFIAENAYKKQYSFRKGYRVPRSWFLYHFLIKGTRAPEKHDSRFGAGNIQEEILSNKKSKIILDYDPKDKINIHEFILV